MTTVVSAYYNMQSKVDHEVYLGWIKDFMKLKCDTVFYTDSEVLTTLQQMANDQGKQNIKFVVLPRKEWVAYQKYGEEFWKWQRSIDTDNWLKNPDIDVDTQFIPDHSPDLYCVWYEKMHFVQRTIVDNPFNSQYFIWCDAGIIRDPAWLLNAKHFGCGTHERNVPKDKIILLNIKPYTESDVQYYKEHSVMPSNKDLMGGGIQGAYPDTWSKWIDTYDKEFSRMVSLGKFVGKDQDILNILAYTCNDLVQRVEAFRYMCPNRWFFLLYVL